MIRVAINGWFLNAPATGTGQYLRELVRALAPIVQQARDQMTLVAPQPDSSAGAPLMVARPRSSGNLAKVEFEQITFPRAAVRGGFAIAHVPHFGPPFRSAIPTVVTIHDLIPLVLPAYRGSPLVRAYTALASASARRARLILADSEASRRDLLAHLHTREDQVRVVYLAADARYRPAPPDQVARIRSKYSLPERFVLYLGGFDVRKNVPLLMRAFQALVAERAAGWRIVLAGRRPARTSPFFPDPLADGAEDVICLDAFDEADKPALYSAASLFAFPSLYEGFGLPPLEAMACGTPVLASDRGSLPEVVGDAGLLLDPEKIDEWVSALSALIGEPSRRRELAVRGITQAARFSWEQTARATWDAYRQALGKSFDN